MQRYHRVLLPLTVVRRRTGLWKTAGDDAMQSGDSPRPIKLGPRRVVWLEEELDAWFERRIAERDAAS